MPKIKQAGYLCPKCQTQTVVKRTTRVDGGLLRDRRCPSCDHRELTSERKLGTHTGMLAIADNAIGSGNLLDFLAMLETLSMKVRSGLDNGGQEAEP